MISIQTLTETEIQAKNILHWPIWEKEPSTFPWQYDETEHCLILAGRAVVRYDDTPVWVQCTDIDRVVALMCYVQLSLWNVPAQIIVGNSLSMEFREILYTPAHYFGLWDMRLKSRKPSDLEKKPNQEMGSEIQPVPKKSQVSAPAPTVQFDFQF